MAKKNSMDTLIYSYMRDMYGKQAEFREGQLEALHTVLAGKRALVVQKTGWGKSLIYFLATKILRKQGRGLTIIISPLLSLINNQITAAEKWGLCAKTINSNNTTDWESIESDLINNRLDVLFIAPERLSNQQFNDNVLRKIKGSIGMLVVDEAHCISDWGHDFRPDYRRIVKIIQFLPPNVPLLATTATANDRVIHDIKDQLGKTLLVLRGDLARESLYLQVIHLNKKEERMAWILQHINELPGTGIIYCLTKRDCQIVERWLNAHNIKACVYTSNLSAEERLNLENSFDRNEIKVLVATVAFGMGIDKPDIGFVIHFQKPGNVIAYYQQIGRAGRNIKKAYAILLVGSEDDHITEYFIRTAFPTAEEMDKVVKALMNEDGISKGRLMQKINLSDNRLNKALQFLTVNGDIYKDKHNYYKSPKKWNPDYRSSKKITELRHQELHQMNDFIQSSDCFMNFITAALNDSQAHRCDNCSNCLPEEKIDISVSPAVIAEAQRFLKNEGHAIEARKKWPQGIRMDGSNTIPDEYNYQDGYVLSNYGDDGWGQIVSKNKYVDNKFSDELIEASYEVLKEKCHVWNISWVTAIPSLRRPNLVRDFAIALAKRLKIPYCDSITKIKNTEEQKKQNNSYWQYMNANESFGVTKVHPGNVLLIDDMVDSRWTLTVCAYKLIIGGSGNVYPFALANTGNS